MKSAGKARNNGLYRHIRTSKEIIRNLLNDYNETMAVRIANDTQPAQPNFILLQPPATARSYALNPAEPIVRSGQRHALILPAILPCYKPILHPA